MLNGFSISLARNKIPPLVHLYSPVLIVVLTIGSRMVLFIMENSNVNVKNVVTEPVEVWSSVGDQSH